MIKRPELRDTWFKSMANELGRLAQGIRDIKGTGTIFLIQKVRHHKTGGKMLPIVALNNNSNALDLC